MSKSTKKWKFSALQKFTHMQGQMWEMVKTDEYWYSGNATSAIVWFKPKIIFLYKFYLGTIFVITNPGVHKAHPRVPAYGIINRKTYWHSGIFKGMGEYSVSLWV